MTNQEALTIVHRMAKNFLQVARGDDSFFTDYTCPTPEEEEAVTKVGYYIHAQQIARLHDLLTYFENADIVEIDGEAVYPKSWYLFEPKGEPENVVFRATTPYGAIITLVERHFASATVEGNRLRLYHPNAGTCTNIKFYTLKEIDL